jgi:hypothetical protein
VNLAWCNVDFEAGRLTVTSPKTEHHADVATRIVPIVPRLHAILMDAFEAAEPDTVLVVPMLRNADANLRTHAHRLMLRAGVEPPPKVFVNLRSSCATDWAKEHGRHVAAKWCGHSPLIALRHYAQVRPEDFDRATGRARQPASPTAPPSPSKGGAESGARAAHNAAQHATATARVEPSESSEVPCFLALSRPDAIQCESLPQEGNGRYWARTSDLHSVIVAR